MYLYFIYFYKLINKIAINQVISPVTDPRSAVLALGLRVNTVDLRPVTGQHENTWLITL